MSTAAPLLLAVDAGTGSCRAMLFDADGRAVAGAARAYSHPEIPGIPGSQVFETDHSWRLICECVREALASADARPDRVAAVSATSMREGMVLYDRDDREIWACPNADSRAHAEVADLVDSGTALAIYATAGDWVSITAPARFRWLAKHEPDTFARIAHVGMLGDWIAHRLCGVHATDPSLGSSSGMFDLAKRDWSARIASLCGVDLDVFPQVLEPGTVLGGITAQAAEQTGLTAGTPVVVGGADTQLGLVGIGVVDSHRFTLVGGSFWQMTGIWDRPFIDPEQRLRTLCHCAPERWMVEGIGFYSGMSLRWFCDAFGARELLTDGQVEDDMYALLEREAAGVPPGANGIFGMFSNLMNAKHWVHGAPGFVGFDITQPQRSGRKECFRAVQESAAYAAYGHLRVVEALASTEAKEVVFTGGAAKGQLWPRIVADVLGLPVRIPTVKESTALGAALCAGVGAGIYTDIAEAAARAARFEQPIEPDQATHADYLQLYDQWRTLYRRWMDLTDTGIVRPLWRAAGT
jgi:autoinducer 2 (AI-2) kinase